MIPLVVLLVSVAAPAPDAVQAADAPPAVRAAVQCDASDDPVLIDRAFGGWLFRFRCPGNNANYMQALVWARDRAGRDARLITFPASPGRPEATEISNVRVFPRTRSLGEIEVDEETDGPCRHERQWRLVELRPVLVFHRHSARCEPGGRWRVRLDRRTRAERAESWR